MSSLMRSSDLGFMLPTILVRLTFRLSAYPNASYSFLFRLDQCACMNFFAFNCLLSNSDSNYLTRIYYSN